MLMPKKTKYRKSHKGSRGGKATGATKVDFGSYGLKSLELVDNTDRLRLSKSYYKHTRKGGQIWIRVFS